MKTAGVKHGEEQRIPEAGAPAREIVVQADGGSAGGYESELKALLLDAVNDSVIVHDLEGCIIYANRAARDLRGYTQEEFLRLNLRDILGGDTESAMEKRMADLTATGRHETESSSRRKDGSEFPVEVNSRLVSIEGQRYVLSVARDIDERKMVEDEALRLKQQVEFILGVTKTGLDIIDQNYNIRYIDPAWQISYGDIAGRKCHEYFMDRQDPCPGCGMIQALESKNAVVTEEILVKEKNRAIQVTTIPFKDVNGEWLVAEVNVDITGRKLAEAALCESEQEFRTIFEKAGDGMFLADLETYKLLKGNASCLKMLGLSQEEFICSDLRDIHPPEELPQIFENIGMFMKGDKDLRMECRFKRKDGSTFASDLSPSPVSYQGKKAVLIVFQDITQRKQEAEALQESRRLFQSYFENAPYGVFIADEKGGYLQVNHAACRITGYTREELLVLSIPDMIPPEERETAGNHFRRAAETGKASGEFAFRHKNGNIRYWSVDAVKLSETRFMGFVQDITERKMIEDELKSSEAQNRALVDSAGRAGEAIVMLQNSGDIPAACLVANQEAVRITGYSQEELKSMAWLDLVHPRYREASQKRIRDRMNSVDVPGIYDISLVSKYGVEIPIEVTGSPVQYQGRPAIVGFFREISQRKKAEAEREKMISELKEALANIKQLKDLIPICASCKKIRNDQGYWQQVDVYLKENTGSDVSHGLCRECADKLYPEFVKNKEARHERE